MRNDAAFKHTGADTAFSPEAEVSALFSQTVRTITVAQALVASNRRVDVQGLQDQIGFLCAKALDLPPGQSGLMRFELTRLVSAVDSLTQSLRMNAA